MSSQYPPAKFKVILENLTRPEENELIADVM